MRVAILSVSAQLGGAERVLVHALHSLAAAESAGTWDVVLTESGPLADLAARAGATVHTVPMPAVLAGTGESDGGAALAAARFAAALPLATGYALALRRVLRRLAPDVVHANGIKAHLFAAAAAPRGAAVVWHVHDFLNRRPLTGHLLRLASRRCAGVVAVSEAVAADVRIALPRLPIAVVPNAIDLAEFAPAGPAADLDALAGLPPAPPGTVRVGLVAAYARWKGHDVFLHAARLTADRPVRFYIVGGPIYRTAAQWSEAELRERAGGLDIGFVPFQAEPAAAYRALDVVVHASTAPEPFGLTIAEAMACGRAVVVSAAGGAAESFADGRDAVAVPPGDIAALAAAVARLSADADERSRLGANARRTAERRFDRARLGPQLLAAYRAWLRPSSS